MSEEIKVQFIPQRRTLLLDCSEDAFAELQALVLARVKIRQSIPTDMPLSNIQISHGPEGQAGARPNWRNDRLALVGCGAVALVVVTLMVIGIGTIVGWLR